MIFLGLLSVSMQMASTAVLPPTGFGSSLETPRSISADGRYVAFDSDASNLVAGDTNGQNHIFVKDLAFGTVYRASASATGAQGNSGSHTPSISADGRYVAFDSDASNLVAGDTNGQNHIFVKDLVTGTITRASVSATGAQGNGGSGLPSISADGRHVAFLSYASNLVAGDNNGKNDIFVKDLVTGTITRASVSATGAEGNDNSLISSLSADGSYVAFDSYANNLVAGDNNGQSDVFVKNLVTGAVARASVSSRGAEGNGNSSYPSISADGRYVAFESDASNLRSDDTNGFFDIFVKDLAIGTVYRASASAYGAQANGGSYSASISADGRYVAFASGASNLVASDTNGFGDVFVKDLAIGTVTRASVSARGAEANSGSSSPSISADGRYVAFASFASNLRSDDTNGLSNVFVKDLAIGTVEPVSTPNF